MDLLPQLSTLTGTPGLPAPFGKLRNVQSLPFGVQCLQNHVLLSDPGKQPHWSRWRAVLGVYNRATFCKYFQLYIYKNLGEFKIIKPFMEVGGT